LATLWRQKNIVAAGPATFTLAPPAIGAAFFSLPVRLPACLDLGASLVLVGQSKEATKGERNHDNANGD
jgi:hypothetical protein